MKIERKKYSREKYKKNVKQEMYFHKICSSIKRGARFRLRLFLFPIWLRVSKFLLSNRRKRRESLVNSAEEREKEKKRE